MAHSLRTLRLVSASALALLMIVGTYVSTGPNPFFGAGRIAIAQTSEELLREYATKDTDTDGLPDWQEALYGTDPANPESFQAGIPDGEAVAQGLISPKVSVRAEEEPTDPDSIPGVVAAPSSLTDRFSQALLQQYLTNRGDTPPSQEEIVGFVKGAVDNLSAQSLSPAVFTQSDVKVAGSGATAVRAYTAAVEAAYAANTVASDKNELSYFADALKGNDAALTQLSRISGAYEDMANAQMALTVPSDVRQAHLTIANGLMRMSEVTGDMATLKTDPLRALMGIALYEKAVRDMGAGFVNLAGIYRAQGIVLTETEPGYEIYYSAVNLDIAPE